VSRELDLAREAIELAEDLIPYVDEYFREKWNFDVELAELRLRLRLMTEG
jgi:aminopeptidase-like protein